MSEAPLFDAAEAGSKGGKARARSLTKSERSESARRAAEARWAAEGKAPPLPATHEGVLKIGPTEIPCAVLEDGTRVLSDRGVTKALGKKNRMRRGHTSDGIRLPSFVSAASVRRFLEKDLEVVLSDPIIYREVGGQVAHGLRAELLPKVCGLWVEADRAGALGVHQKHIAEQASLLLRGFAEVGIVALVDEATGYQDARSRDALATILEEFIAKELRPWVRTFPPSFYKEMFRLRGLPYSGKVQKPQYIGKLTNDIVYSRLAPGVLDELQLKNPANAKGHRKHRHHQWLTEHQGYQKLAQHLAVLEALMRLSTTWEGFKEMLDKAVPKHVPMPLFERAK